jgi:hypothetical protein
VTPRGPDLAAAKTTVPATGTKPSWPVQRTCGMKIAISIPDNVFEDAEIPGTGSIKMLGDYSISKRNGGFERGSTVTSKGVSSAEA